MEIIDLKTLVGTDFKMYGRSQLTRDLHQAPRHEDG
jgi:hypothetical protein